MPSRNAADLARWVVIRQLLVPALVAGTSLIWVVVLTGSLALLWAPLVVTFAALTLHERSIHETATLPDTGRWWSGLLVTLGIVMACIMASQRHLIWMAWLLIFAMPALWAARAWDARPMQSTPTKETR